MVGWDKVRAGYGGPAQPGRAATAAHPYGGLLVVGWDKVARVMVGLRNRSSRDRGPTHTAVCLW